MRPEIALPREAPGNPITDETRRELKALMDKQEIPRIPYVQWKNLSEEEGQLKIEHAYARRPASEKQKEFIRQALLDKTIPGKILKEIFPTRTISGAQVDKLNFLQATRLIGSLPATAKQIEAVKNLVAEKRIEPLENYDLSTAQASKILDKAYRDVSERDPDGPASLRQKEALNQLMESRAIPVMSREQLENLTFAEAGQASGECSGNPCPEKYDYQIRSGGKTFPDSRRGIQLHDPGGSIQTDRYRHGKTAALRTKITPESEIPATEAQRKVLEELREKGKIPELPDNLSKEAASRMIKEAVSADPISPRQMDIIEKRIANHQIPPMTPEQKAGLTQRDFAELMKIQPKSPAVPDRGNGNERSKAPEMVR